MKNTLIFNLFFWGFSVSVHAQEQNSRDVIVTTDTCIEINNTRKSGTITDPYIENGLEIKVLETPFSIAYVRAKKKDNLNGLYIEFYLPSNMPKVKGNYLENNKNGEWYYWNEKGKLLKKEIWKKGKLLNSTLAG